MSEPEFRLSMSRHEPAIRGEVEKKHLRKVNRTPAFQKWKVLATASCDVHQREQDGEERRGVGGCKSKVAMGWSDPRVPFSSSSLFDIPDTSLIHDTKYC